MKDSRGNGEKDICMFMQRNLMMGIVWICFRRYLRKKGMMKSSISMMGELSSTSKTNDKTTFFAQYVKQRRCFQNALDDVVQFLRLLRKELQNVFRNIDRMSIRLIR